MTFAFVCLLLVLIITMIARQLLVSRIGYLTVPLLAALILLVWYVPQALIVSSENIVPEAGQSIIAVMALLCLAAVFAGWHFGARSYLVKTPVGAVKASQSTPLSYAVSKIPAHRLYLLTIGFVMVAAIVQFLISRQPPEALTARQPTGLIVILRTLSIVNPVALFLSFMLLLQKRNVVTVGLVLLALATFVGPILIKFKRNEMMEFAVVILFCLWAMRRFSIPRAAVPVFAILGVFVLFGASEIRKQTGYVVNDSGQLEREIVTLDTISNVDWGKVIEEGAASKAYEVTNGAYAVEYATRNELPTLGARFWNQFIFRWVPGQIVGYELKQSLLFKLEGADIALQDSGLTWQQGTTSTGFTEIYLDFSFPSALFFFFMAFITRRNFDRGLCGDLASAAVYAPMAILVMVSFTHGGYYFYLAMPLILGMQFGIRLLAQQERLIPVPKNSAIELLPYPGHAYGRPPAIQSGAGA